MLKTRTRLSLQDKWLFKIREVKITRVDCTIKAKTSLNQQQNNDRYAEIVDLPILLFAGGEGKCLENGCRVAEV